MGSGRGPVGRFDSTRHLTCLEARQPVIAADEDHEVSRHQAAGRG